MVKRKPIFPTTYFFLFFLLTIIFYFLLPQLEIVIPPYSYLGFPLIILGLYLILYTDFLFKKMKTTIKPDEKPSFFIDFGPFRFSRHPMYLGFISLLTGVSLTLGNLACFLAPLGMFFVSEKIFIPLEEKNLEKVFGKKYYEYKQRTRKWL